MAIRTMQDNKNANAFYMGNKGRKADKGVTAIH